MLKNYMCMRLCQEFQKLQIKIWNRTYLMKMGTVRNEKQKVNYNKIQLKLQKNYRKNID